jgi:hypothetical protein
MVAYRHQVQGQEGQEEQAHRASAVAVAHLLSVAQCWAGYWVCYWARVRPLKGLSPVLVVRLVLVPSASALVLDLRSGA